MHVRAVRSLLLGAAVAAAVLGTTPGAWASGGAAAVPDPVVVSPTAPTTTRLTVSVTAADPLPDGIDAVVVELSPATGGIGFSSGPDGCTIGPATVLRCPWAPGAALETVSLVATVSVAPGIPAQQVPLRWTVTSSLSQDPVDEGTGSFAVVTEAPTPTPSPTSSTATGSPVPLPTAVPAGADDAGAAPTTGPAPLLLVLGTAAVVGVVAGARRGRRRT